MKSFLQGLTTGGVLVFAFMVLIGQKNMYITTLTDIMTSMT